MDKNTLQAWWIVIAVVMSWISMFFSSTVETNENVIALIPQFEQLKEEVKADKQDLADWKSGWELPLDVAQNKDIEFLKSYVSDLKVKVEKIEEVIQKIEIEQATNF